MDRLIGLEPSNVVAVRLEPGQRCYGELTLRNVMYTMPVAFRLQPVDKSRYTVKPQSGIIAPLATLTVEIAYNLLPAAGSVLPELFPRSDDSFLLHSVVVPGAASKDATTMFDSVPSDWFTAKKKQVFIDSGIKIMFVGSPVLVQLVSDGSMDELREVLERSEQSWRPEESCDLQGQTLLHIAIAHGRPDIVQLLLEFKPNVELESRTSGSTPLEAAAAAGEALIVELLLAHKAKTERTGSSSASMSPIHLAARNGHLEVLRLLLVKGANPDLMTKDGNTALHLAVSERRRDCARLLLASGAKPDIRNQRDGETPLHVAAGVGDEQMVMLLLQKGANKYIRNMAGKTTYDVAAESGYTRLFDALKLGDSFCVAARKGEARLLQKFIENGAIIHGRDQHGWTALHRASFKGKTEAVKLLVQKGIDIDAKDEDGFSALHCAVESGHAEVVDLLVKKGADVDARTNKNLTCLHIADSLQYVGITRILVHGGASRDGAAGGGQGSNVQVSIPRELMRKDQRNGKLQVARSRRPGSARALRTCFDRPVPLTVV